MFCLDDDAMVLAILGPVHKKLNLKHPTGKTLPAPHLASHIPAILRPSCSGCLPTLEAHRAPVPVPGVSKATADPAPGKLQLLGLGMCLQDGLNGKLRQAQAKRQQQKKRKPVKPLSHVIC